MFGAAFLACLSFAVIQGEESGYTAPWIVTLFVLCGLSGIAFVITEKKVKSPMLDLSMFRLPPFAGSNFVAFVAYFGTFSIFFFTALCTSRSWPTRRPTRRRWTSCRWRPG